MEKETYPFLSTNLGWSPNARHSLNLALSYSKEPMSANLKSPNILRENEFLYYSGNPQLQYSPNIMGNLGYNWIPNDWLQISPFSQFFGIFDRYVPVYESFLDGNAILRKYENDGNHYRSQVGVSITVKLLNGNLQLQAIPSQFFYKSTGYYDISIHPFALSCSAVYYSGDFYFSTFYEMGNHTLWSNSGTIYHDRSQVQISAGWSHSDVNLRLGLSNPFRTSWLSSSKAVVSPVYTEHITTYGPISHVSLNLSLTYTIGYGKKVTRTNEVTEQDLSPSAILK